MAKSTKRVNKGCLPLGKYSKTQLVNALKANWSRMPERIRMGASPSTMTRTGLCKFFSKKNIGNKPLSALVKIPKKSGPKSPKRKRTTKKKTTKKSTKRKTTRKSAKKTTKRKTSRKSVKKSKKSKRKTGRKTNKKSGKRTRK